MRANIHTLSHVNIDRGCHELSLKRMWIVSAYYLHKTFQVDCVNPLRNTGICQTLHNWELKKIRASLGSMYPALPYRLLTEHSEEKKHLAPKSSLKFSFTNSRKSRMYDTCITRLYRMCLNGSWYIDLQIELKTWWPRGMMYVSDEHHQLHAYNSNVNDNSSCQ